MIDLPYQTLIGGTYVAHQHNTSIMPMNGMRPATISGGSEQRIVLARRASEKWPIGLSPIIVSKHLSGQTDLGGRDKGWNLLLITSYPVSWQQNRNGCP